MEPSTRAQMSFSKDSIRLWDAYSSLGFTERNGDKMSCASISHTRDRCPDRMPEDRYRKIRGILDEFEKKPPHDALSLLPELAQLCCCLKYHQNDGFKLVDNWKRFVKGAEYGYQQAERIRKDNSALRRQVNFEIAKHATVSEELNRLERIQKDNFALRQQLNIEIANHATVSKELNRLENNQDLRDYSDSVAKGVTLYSLKKDIEGEKAAKENAKRELEVLREINSRSTSQCEANSKPLAPKQLPLPIQPMPPIIHPTTLHPTTMRPTKRSTMMRAATKRPTAVRPFQNTPRIFGPDVQRIEELKAQLADQKETINALKSQISELNATSRAQVDALKAEIQSDRQGYSQGLADLEERKLNLEEEECKLLHRMTMIQMAQDMGVGHRLVALMLEMLKNTRAWGVDVLDRAYRAAERRAIEWEEGFKNRGFDILNRDHREAEKRAAACEEGLEDREPKRRKTNI
ncbi:uncharacterized protein LY89DRAFT_747310 [Mollisia scopiformis]|uniref:Uncharacterized protein n=1 Tax=Mollisia scopiformis TaxID=149040 RepID=A0A194XBT9_MOLSC|nr:uncharacterized protein LY89DRAFT_747310 [Mollisia scopiformis]KUJ17630.1 hypothetical protein LY89DRAFT_747310 [Mollisia scopiformis]